MKVKLALLLGGAAGYVLGARDGRQRYEQIKAKVEEIWHHPTVRQKMGQATDNATDLASQMTHTAGQAAGVTNGSGSTEASDASHGGQDRHA